MKYLVCTLMLLFTPLGYSHGSNEHDLEATMKKMGLAYKQAIQATSLAEFDEALARFTDLVSDSKHQGFPAEHKAKSLEGLNKVLEQVALAQKVAHEQGLEQGKQPLQEIDILRKEYHKLHKPPGIWEILFG